MSNHETRVIHVGDRWGARCTCHWAPPTDEFRWQAEDQVLAHLDAVRRVRMHNGTDNPSLKSQRDYYRSMERDPNTSRHDRVLWKQLADELSHRLGDDVREDQPTLM
jgi:hypothetical protein